MILSTAINTFSLVLLPHSPLGHNLPHSKETFVFSGRCSLRLPEGNAFQ